MNVKIRQATTKDLDTVTEIEEICFPAAEAASRQSLEKRIKAFTEGFLVAEIEGKIVGFINGSIINQKTLTDEFYSDISLHDPKGDYQSIFGLDVLPEYRRMGIAAELMNALIDVAKKSERKGLTLCCKAEKIHYYAKFGYVDLGKSKSEHGNAVWYDMILMLGKN